MHLDLYRTNEFGGATIGVLSVDDAPVCLILERAWRDNERNVSCIPAGGYAVQTGHKSPRFGWCWKIIDVPDRTDILFHPGNTEDDTLGCLLPGSAIGEMDEKLAVLGSKTAFTRLREITGIAEDEVRTLPLRIHTRPGLGGHLPGGKYVPA